MGDSIAAAVRATPDAAGWLVLPADLPLICAQTLVDLAQAQPDAEVLLPVFAGQRGHPVRFGRGCAMALASLHGEQGAARVVAGHAAVHWPVDDAGCVSDIDTLADLQRVRNLMNTHSNKN
jgi:molybdenum cofactor cytidylyltransferase